VRYQPFVKNQKLAPQVPHFGALAVGDLKGHLKVIDLQNDNYRFLKQAFSFPMIYIMSGCEKLILCNFLMYEL